MISCVNIQYQFADNFKAIHEFRGVACVFNNICNNTLMANLKNKSEDKGNL